MRETGRMTKLMITRQCHSRSVKKTIAFILYFSNCATKKTLQLNQERSWGFGGSFSRWGETWERREALLFPPRDATDNFVTDCYVRFADSVICCWYITLSGQTSLTHLLNQCHGICSDLATRGYLYHFS